MSGDVGRWREGDREYSAGAGLLAQRLPWFLGGLYAAGTEALVGLRRKADRWRGGYGRFWEDSGVVAKKLLWVFE